MKYAINLLEKERELLVEALKNGEKEKVCILQQLDKALSWLRLIEEKELYHVNQYELEVLPPLEGRGGFSNYRIAIDNETDDINFWDEYKREGNQNLLLSFGDIVLRRK